MKPYARYRRYTKHRNPSTLPSPAFTIIELLTVMFIISVLMAILIPALSGARDSAKKTATAAMIRSIEAGLDLFKNDNERDFRQTNGYPPSAVHPPIPGYTGLDPDKIESRFPFIPNEPTAVRGVYGAHWLPAMLVGVDQQGYVSKRGITKRAGIHKEPFKWYLPDPLKDGKPLPRKPLYLNPDDMNLTATEDLSGIPNLDLFPDWDKMKRLPVITDAFGQPILYYAANAGASGKNLVAEQRTKDNIFTGGIQEAGTPYYFHKDNEGFTGHDDERGWQIKRSADGHAISYPGNTLDAQEIAKLPDKNDASTFTFARFIMDRSQLRQFDDMKQSSPPRTIEPATPLRPANPDSYLLMSPGADSIWGTGDDVTNFPLTTGQ